MHLNDETPTTGVAMAETAAPPGLPQLPGMPEMQVVHPDEPAGDARLELDRLLHPWSALKQSFISWGTMSWPLQLALLAAVLSIVLSGAFVLLRNLPQPHQLIHVYGVATPLNLPILPFVLIVFTWVLAWAFALTGAIYGHWALRLVVLAAFIYLASQSVALSLPLALPWALIFVWALVGSLAAMRATRVGRPIRRRWPAITFVFILAMLLLRYAYLFLLYTSSEGSLLRGTAFVMSMQGELAMMAFFLLPVVFLTGSDFAEASESGASLVALWLRSRSTRLLPLGLALLTAVIAGVELARRGAFRPPYLLDLVNFAFVVGLGLVIVLLLWGLCWLGQVGQWRPTSVPSGAFVTLGLAVLVLPVSGGIVGAILLAVLPLHTPATVSYAVYQHSGRPTFSMAYPASWNPSLLDDQRPDGLFGLEVLPVDDTNYPSMLVFAIPSDWASKDNMTPQQEVVRVVNTFCNSCSPTLAAVPSSGGWHVLSTSVPFTQQHENTPQRAEVWAQTRTDAIWVVMGTSPQTEFSTYQPIYAQSLQSWRPNLMATAPVVPRHDAPFIDFLFHPYPQGALSLAVLPVLLGLCVGLPLLARGREHGGTRAAAGLFFATAGICVLLLDYPSLCTLFHLKLSSVALFTIGAQQVTASSLPTLNRSTIQLLVAVGTLVALGWWTVRRVPHRRLAAYASALLIANLGLLLLNIIVIVLDKTNALTSGATRTSTAVGVCLLIAAFLWDLLTSGASLRNRSSVAAPRYTRLLISCGYSMLATIIALFLTVIPSPETANIDLSNWPQLGIQFLGVPAVLVASMMALARARHAAPLAPYAAPTGASAAANSTASGHDDAHPVEHIDGES